MTLTYFPMPNILETVPLSGHAVLEASAGTGKTYTIEHLVVDRLIRTDATLEEILVVTFTEKATSELRARIRLLVQKVLESDLETPPSGPHWVLDTDAKQALEAALFAFDRAPIYTIHGFCHRALFDMAFESGQLFEQTLANPRQLFYRAFRETLRETLAVKEPLRGTLREWLESGRTEEALERLLRGAHGKGYLDSRDYLPTALPALLEAFHAGLDPAAILHDFSLCALQAKALPAAQATLKAIAAVFDEHDSPEARLRTLVNMDVSALLKPRRTGSKKKRPFPDGLAEDSKLTLDRLRRLKVMAALEASDERAIVDACLPAVTKRLNRIKAAEGLLDFDDLLARVWQAMEREGGDALTNALRDRYRYGLIDEFQDTDRLQWQIFRRIFVEGGTGSLYLIGDPKQAIYAFRGADVHTYLEAKKELVESGATQAPLSVNFRSSAATLDAINTILDQQAAHPLMTGEIVYDTPVSCGRPDKRAYTRYDEPAAPVVVWRYDPPPPRGRRMDIPAWQIERTMLVRLGASLRRLLTDPAGSLFVTDDESPTARRQITARDVFVLVRTKREAVAVADALRVNGVPYCLYKQDGLFQTREARDTLALLRAIADPADRGARLRALATPFFGAAWNDLPRYRNLPAHHPAVTRLLAWRKVAESERVAALFIRLLDESGLVERELFFADSERELTNYQHILELLLEVTAQRRLSLPEVVETLQQYVDGMDLPDGVDGNIQRLPSERDAVQIITQHKSKGLEAEVVVLFGGYRPAFQDTVAVIRDEGRRKVLIGKTAQDSAADRIALAAERENQRLLYVALTRAKSRLYLPLIDTSRTVSGSYRPLNDRLRALTADGAPDGFEVIEAVHSDKPPVFERPEAAEPIEAWCPDPKSLDLGEVDSAEAAALYGRHAPLVVTSYTRLKAEAASRDRSAPVDAEEFKRDEAGANAVEAETQRLPGGRYMGRFLHEAIEGLPLGTLEHPFAAWAQRPDVARAFKTAMRRHDIDSRWLPPSQRLVYDTLTRPTPLGAEVPPAQLYACLPNIIEMEFLFPIPEAHHPLLTAGLPEADADWTVERGFVKGFIDYIFTHEGRIYFCDWKSDLLPHYDAATVAEHAREHYDLQARLYTLGVCRWLGIRDEASYEAQFGGLLYVFMRGRSAFDETIEGDGDDTDGVYFQRPDFATVAEWEQALMTSIPEGSS